MKIYNIYTGVILIFLLSCATKKDNNKAFSINTNDSIKEKYEELNDYFDTQIKEQSKEIIMKEKITTNMTLKLLKINDIWSTDSVGMGRKDETFYQEEDWEKLRKENGNSSTEKIKNALMERGECCWTSANFKYKEIIFEDLEVGKSDFEKKYISSPSYNIYWFSEPVYYKNKEYIIFTTYKASLGGFGSIVRLIIMKKIKNKLIQSYQGIPDWHS